MKTKLNIKLSIAALALLLTGCAQSNLPVYHASEVGQVRAVGGNIMYQRANNQVSQSSINAMKRHEESEHTRGLNAMELDMIEQQRKNDEQDAYYRKHRKESECRARVGFINDQIRIRSIMSIDTTAADYRKTMQELKAVQAKVLKECK